MNGEFGIVTGPGDVGDDGFVGSVVSGKCVILGEPGTTCGECRMELFSDPRLISDFPISDPPPITDPLGSNTSSVPFAYTNLTWLRGSGKVDGANEGGGCKTRARVTPTEDPGRDSGRDRIGSDGERLGDSPSMPIGEAPGGRGESSGGVGDEFRDEGCMLFAKKNFPWLGWWASGGLDAGFVLRTSPARKNMGDGLVAPYCDWRDSDLSDLIESRDPVALEGLWTSSAAEGGREGMCN